METFDVFEESSDMLASMGVDIKEFAPIKEEEKEQKDKQDNKDKDEEVAVIEEEKNTPLPDSKDTTVKQPQNHILSSLAEAIRDEGYISEEDNEKLKLETPSDFIKFLDKIRDTALDVEQSDWNDYQKEYFQALKDGVPHGDIQQHQQRQFAYSSIKKEDIRAEENEDLRRQILMANYTMKGFNEQKATKMVNKLFDDGEDVAEALDALEEIVITENNHFKAKQEASRAAEEKAAKKQEEEAKALKTYVESVTEVIPGITVTPKARKEAYNALTKAVATKEDGQKLNIIGKFFDSATPEDLFKFSYILLYTDGLKKLETISPAKAKKEVHSKIEEVLSKNIPSSLGFTKDESDGVYDGIDDVWKQMDKFL